QTVLASHVVLVERRSVGGEDRRLATEVASGEEGDGGGVDEERVHLVERLPDGAAGGGATRDAPGKDAGAVLDRDPARPQARRRLGLGATEVEIVGDAPERLLHHERDAAHPGLSGT